MGQRAALKITVDTRDDVVGGDHVHAPGKGAHDIGAEPDEILLIAIPNWQDAGAPTTSIAATFQHAHGVDELMRGIRFPVWLTRSPATTTHGRSGKRGFWVGTAAARCMRRVTGQRTPWA
jgi:hypothetical protein